MVALRDPMVVGNARFEVSWTALVLVLGAAQNERDNSLTARPTLRLYEYTP